MLRRAGRALTTADSFESRSVRAGSAVPNSLGLRDSMMGQEGDHEVTKHGEAQRLLKRTRKPTPPGHWHRLIMIQA
jgi:hypothetical protein